MVMKLRMDSTSKARTGLLLKSRESNTFYLLD
jgi:hypothetical protein